MVQFHYKYGFIVWTKKHVNPNQILFHTVFKNCIKFEKSYMHSAFIIANPVCEMDRSPEFCLKLLV